MTKTFPYIEDLAKGKGSPKHYKYWSGYIDLNTKSAIRQAIEPKIAVFREDKITGEVQVFDEQKGGFIKVKY